MDSLLTEARERLTQRGEERRRFAATPSLAASARTGSDAVADGGPAAAPAGATAEPEDAAPRETMVVPRARAVLMVAEAATARGRAAVTPSLPAIFDTELTSSDESAVDSDAGEESDDVDDGADATHHGAAGSMFLQDSSNSSDEEGESEGAAQPEPAELARRSQSLSPSRQDAPPAAPARGGGGGGEEKSGGGEPEEVEGNRSFEEVTTDRNASAAVRAQPPTRGHLTLTPSFDCPHSGVYSTRTPAGGAHGPLPRVLPRPR